MYEKGFAYLWELGAHDSRQQSQPASAALLT